MPVSGPQYVKERRGGCEEEEQLYRETRERPKDDPAILGIIDEAKAFPDESAKK